MMKYGERVRAARRKRGYTLKKMSELTGVAYSTLDTMERGRHQSRLGTACLLADVLDVSLDWLAGRTADPYSHKRKRNEK